MGTDFRFGRFQLLRVERQLLADGVPVKLGARAFDLLLALVERSGQTVSRRELLDLVWPGRVVEDQNLQVHVVALRKALGPNAIATIPGRGYRFTLPLDAPSPSRDDGAGLPPHAHCPLPPAAAGSSFALPRLYGRAADVDAVCRLVFEHRLVTIAGPGGIGKTRLAQAVAARAKSCCADGVAVVELAALADGDMLPTTVARALGFSASGAQATAVGLAQSLRPLSLLVVLDNCEHLLAATSRLVEALLVHAPNVRLLLTSQEPLRSPDEHVYRLEGLALPAPGARAALDDGAAALLVARARAIEPRFTLSDANVDIVVDICRRLDGIPLALELAAARLPLLGAAGLRDRLDERLRLLSAGARTAPPRQQTLRRAFEWSHGLLSAEQKIVFRRLGTFAGSFSLPSAQTVAADERIDAWAVLDHLAALVDKSLVQLLPDDEPRYRLLESTRAFALEQLADACEVDGTRARHVRAMFELFDRADAEYFRTPTLPWAERLMPDLDNLREALNWSLGPRSDPQAAIALGGCTGGFWLAAGLATEGAQRLERIAPLIDAATPPRSEARFWLALATLSGNWGVSAARALEAAQRALALFRRLGDREYTYRTLSYYLLLPERLGLHFDEAAVLAEMESLEGADWSPLQRRARRWAQAQYLMRQYRWTEYRSALREEIALLTAAGDERGVWLASHLLAVAEVIVGNAPVAVELMENVVAGIRARGLLRRYWAQAAMLALARIELNDPIGALPAVRDAVKSMCVEGTLWRLADHLAWLVAQRGRYVDAARLQGWADARYAAQGERRGSTAINAHAVLDSMLRRVLSEAELANSRSDGARLSDDEAAAIVLEEAA